MSEGFAYFRWHSFIWPFPGSCYCDPYVRRLWREQQMGDI